MKLFIVGVVALFLIPSLHARELSCRSTDSNYRAEFTVQYKDTNPLSPYPTLEWKASIQGFQDGEPGTFARVFQSAVVSESRLGIAVTSDHRDEPANKSRNKWIYRASFDAFIDARTLRGKFQAVDNSETGSNSGNRYSRANEDDPGAVNIKCRLKTQ